MLACSGFVVLWAPAARAASPADACPTFEPSPLTGLPRCSPGGSLARSGPDIGLFRLAPGGALSAGRPSLAGPLRDVAFGAPASPDEPTGLGAVAALTAAAIALPHTADLWRIAAPVAGAAPVWPRGPDRSAEDFEPDSPDDGNGFVALLRNGGHIGGQIGSGKLDLDLFSGEFAYSIPF
jgi:hypothetical protein